MVKSESVMLMESLCMTDEDKQAFKPIGPLAHVMKNHIGEIFLANDVHHRDYKGKVLTEIGYQLEDGGYGCRITPALDFRSLRISNHPKFDNLKDMATVNLADAMRSIAVFKLDAIEWTGEFPFRWSMASEVLAIHPSDEVTSSEMKELVHLYHSEEKMRKPRSDARDWYEIAKIFIIPLS